MADEPRRGPDAYAAAQILARRKTCDHTHDHKPGERGGAPSPGERAAAGIAEESQERLLRRVLLCQSSRVRAYRVFHDSLVDYLEGGESNMYRAVTGAVTVEFAAMSAVMTACREALVGGPEGGPLAAAVDQMQQLEKQKLQLTALLHEARVAYAMRRRGEAGAGALVSAAPGAGEGEGADAHYTGEGAGTRCREDATAERNELIVGAVDALCGAALGEGYTGTLLELGRPPQPPRVPEQTSCLWGVWEDPTVARVEADVERIEAQVREVMEEVRAELASLAE